MRIKRAACLWLASAMLLAMLVTGCAKQSGDFKHQPDFDVASTSALLIELNSGNIIFEKAPDDRATPYALTQMLTALLAIEETEDLSSDIASPVALDGSESETSYTMEQLLRYIIFDSHTQAAQLVAFTVGGGDQNSFISRLNERARGLGAKSTNFADASGEDVANNYTTARDIAMIAKAVYQNNIYMSIAGESSYTLPSSDTHDEETIDNNSDLEDAGLTGVTGIKYGTGGEGLANLVCVTEQNGMKLLLVLLGAPQGGDTSVFEDAKGLFDWTLTTCKLVKGPKSGEPVTGLAVAEGFAQDKVALTLTKKLDSVLPKTAVPDDVYLLCRTHGIIDAATGKGAVVGSADILYENELLLSLPLVTDRAVNKKGAAPAWANVLLGIGGMILGLFVLLLIVRQINIIRYRRKRLKRLDEKRRLMRSELEKTSGTPRPPMKR